MMTFSWTDRYRAPSRRRVVVFATAALLCLIPFPRPVCAEIGEEQPSPEMPRLEELLQGYNENIGRAAVLIDSLRVNQEMVEPTEDGSSKGARAVLSYSRDEGMGREELFSDLGHPVGEYQLSSLVGPALVPDEYDVTLVGVEGMEGRSCYRLDVTAVERDADHFDGSVWVEVGSLGLVRITGVVADPPFPVRRIGLDKAFEPVPEGFRLLRRHTGEIDIRMGFIKRQGTMHIFYTDYELTLSQ